MGMKMTQKILAAHAGLEYVEAGQLIEADLDLVLGNDITSPVAIKEMEKMERERQKAQKAALKTQPKVRSLHYIDDDDYEEDLLMIIYSLY